MKPTPHLTQSQLDVPTLGERRHQSPLELSSTPGDGRCDFIPDDARILLEPRFLRRRTDQSRRVRAGWSPRADLLRSGEEKAAIVTCGGLWPGINNVVRTLVLELTHNYGVPEVLGIRYGYEGLNPRDGRPPMRLTPETGRQHPLPRRHDSRHLAWTARSEARRSTS